MSILEAAKDIFARKGWATTISDIASAASVSPGLIYHYFANKEAIFCELLGQTIQSDLDIFQQLMQSGDTAAQRLETLISSMLKFRQDQIKRFGITVQAAKETSSSGNELEIMRRIFKNLKSDDGNAKDLHELMMKRMQTIHEIVLQLIVEGQKNGEFALDPPPKLALMIFQSIQGLTTLALDKPEEYEQHYPYTDIIMRMLYS
ncbi:TetR/AcrR family transcriptional regulator [Cohnella cellulosilytica]|uniref:TetR/AcrR family transcriptional regulator n=1 Tax=Cohnella cellulosilytica TaxID=986710 RepID=A0ABW2FHJ7_9BACL